MCVCVYLFVLVAPAFDIGLSLSLPAVCCVCLYEKVGGEVEKEEPCVDLWGI